MEEVCTQSCMNMSIAVCLDITTPVSSAFSEMDSTTDLSTLKEILPHSIINIVTCVSSTRQRLATYVPERHAINKNKRSLLNNGFSYHGTKEARRDQEAD
jgi:hypothetical protein